MPMPMVDIGVVWMCVSQSLVSVRMAVWFTWWVVVGVFMLMMLVVNVKVVVFQWLMNVFVFVTLTQVQPHADAHQGSGQSEVACQSL
jgi:hypothetical protein